MLAFVIQSGTRAKALRADSNGIVHTDTILTNRRSLYVREDVTVDPYGSLVTAAGPGGVTVGAAYAEAGYYGFRLPRNDRGYTTLLVHVSNVETN